MKIDKCERTSGSVCVICQKFKFCVSRTSSEFGAVIVSMVILMAVSEASCAFLREYFLFPGS